MVPAYLSEPPAPKKAAGKAAKAERPANSLVPKADKALDEANNIQTNDIDLDIREPVEDTWVRGTTNDAMVPAALSMPPKAKAPAAKALIQLEAEPHTTSDSETVRKTWERGTTNNAMVPAYLSEPPVAKESAKPVSLGKKSPPRKGASAAPPKASDTVEGEELNVQL